MEGIWKDFETKLGDLFKTGRDLPLSLHILAVRSVQEKLDVWKDELGLASDCIIIQPDINPDKIPKKEASTPRGAGTRTRGRQTVTPAKFADYETPAGKTRGKQSTPASSGQNNTSRKRKNEDKDTIESQNKIESPQDVPTPRRRGRPRKIVKKAETDDEEEENVSPVKESKEEDETSEFISAVLEKEASEDDDGEDGEELETYEESPTDPMSDIIQIKQEIADKDNAEDETKGKKSRRGRRSNKKPLLVEESSPDEENCSDEDVKPDNDDSEKNADINEDIADAAEDSPDEASDYDMNQDELSDKKIMTKEEADMIFAQQSMSKKPRKKRSPKLPGEDTPKVPKKRGRPKRTVYEVGAPIVKKFTCDQCPRKFAHEQNLKKHKKLHETGPLECPHCEKVFYSSGGFTYHLVSHTGKDLQCPQCPYTSLRSASMANHIRTVHMKDDPASKPFLCSVCGAAFSKSVSLKSHEEVHGPQEKTHSCPQCSHKTHSRTLLMIHIRNIHKPRDLFVCNICGAQCRYRQNLIDHEKRHFGHKNVECEHCDKKFINRSVLAQHMRVHKERQYRCDVCLRKFATKSHLSRHITIHTGEKEFTCSHCSYCCNVKSNLKKHLRTVHKVEVEYEGIMQRVTRIHEIKQHGSSKHLIAEKNDSVDVTKQEVVEGIIIKEYPDTTAFLQADGVIYNTNEENDAVESLHAPQVHAEDGSEMVIQTVVSEEIVQSAMQHGEASNVETVYLPVTSPDQCMATLQPVTYVYGPAQALPSTAWSSAVAEAVENIPKQEEDIPLEQIIIYQ